MKPQDLIRQMLNDPYAMLGTREPSDMVRALRRLPNELKFTVEKFEQRLQSVAVHQDWSARQKQQFLQVMTGEDVTHEQFVACVAFFVGTLLPRAAYDCFFPSKDPHAAD